MKKLIGMIAALAMITGSAYAADWNFYGSARVSTFVTDADSTDNTSFAEGLQGNSRIGAKVKANDSVSGRFEYGASGGKANVRLLYGTWNFGAGALTVGQDYTPMNAFYSNQVYAGDADLLAQGGIYSGRKAQVALKFGGFEIAAVQTQSDALGLTDPTIETNFPGVEMAYKTKFNNIGLFLTAGYNTYEINELDVDTWIVGAGAKADFGSIYLAGNIYTGQNAGHMIAIDIDNDGKWNDGKAKVAGGKVVDNDALGFILVAGYKANDMFTFEAGYGYAKTEFDEAASDDDTATAYYLQSVITLAPGVYVIPEIGVVDGEDAGEEKNTYYGAKWQINF